MATINAKKIIKQVTEDSLVRALDHLENLAIRFPLEHRTTEKSCACIQFEDQDSCRHVRTINFLQEHGRLSHPWDLIKPPVQNKKRRKK